MNYYCCHDLCDEKVLPGKPFCALHTNPAMEDQLRRAMCGHPGCNKRRARPQLMFCEDHLVGELTVEPVERPTTEDLAAEHDEVLAEVSEALGVWRKHTSRAAEHFEAARIFRKEMQRNERAAARMRDSMDADMDDYRMHSGNADTALANLSPAAREQLEARRVVVLDGTTYVVDASGDEMQLLVSDPWVIS